MLDSFQTTPSPSEWPTETHWWDSASEKDFWAARADHHVSLASVALDAFIGLLSSCTVRHSLSQRLRNQLGETLSSSGRHIRSRRLKRGSQGRHKCHHHVLTDSFICRVPPVPPRTVRSTSARRSLHADSSYPFKALARAASLGAYKAFYQLVQDIDLYSCSDQGVL